MSRRALLLSFLSVGLGVAGAVAPACSAGGDLDPGTLSNADATTDGSDAPGIDGLKAIAVTPGSADLVTDGTSSQAFTALGTFTDGSARDVTSQVTWSVDRNDVLLMTGATAKPTGNVGGEVVVTAAAGSISGTAKVRVKLARIVAATGASATDAAKFAGAPDPSLNAALAYPLDGALLPTNLQPMEVQWKPAGSATLFDVAFTGALLDVHLLTPCNAIGTTGGCGVVPDDVTWRGILATARGGDPIQVTVKSTADGSKLGTSTSASLQVASGDVAGGLYFFNTRGEKKPDGSSSGPGIFRFDFQTSTIGPFFTEGQCAGCHALSRDGTRMLAAVCTPDVPCASGAMQLVDLDVASKAATRPPLPDGDSYLQAWTSDNKYFVTAPACSGTDPAKPYACTGTTGGLFKLWDATTRTKLGDVPTGAGALHPAFSNDDKHFAFVRGNPYYAPISTVKSSIFTMSFVEGSPPTWGAPTPLVQSAGEDNNYYPDYSPDDAWVLFTRSQCGPGDPVQYCDAYDDPSARILVVPAGGGAPIDLARANGSGHLDNSWPKWSPFKGTYKGGDIYWFTISSVRDYGFRATTIDPTPVKDNGNPTHVRQLWLVGFDMAKAKAGLDPSFAPVWLPFQDVQASNHIGQWTTKVVGPAK